MTSKDSESSRTGESDLHAKEDEPDNNVKEPQKGQTTLTESAAETTNEGPKTPKTIEQSRQRKSSRLASKAESAASGRNVSEETDSSSGIWTPRQKRRLLIALKEHGSRSIKKLEETANCGKSAEAIAAMINKIKKKNEETNNTIRVSVVETGELNSSFYIKKRKSNKPQRNKRSFIKMKNANPLEKWLELMRTKAKANSSAKSVVLALDGVAKLEKQPDNGRVDFAAIYETVASLMRGDVPKQLDGPTQVKFCRIVDKFTAFIREKEPQFEAEMKAMSSFRLADLSKENPAVMKTVNPLCLPAEFFTKTLL